MSSKHLVIALAVLAMAAGGHASAQTASPGSEAAWAGEAKFWADYQKAGDGADLISHYAETFTGWPCGRSSPDNKSSLKSLEFRPVFDVAIDRRSSVVGSDFVITYYRAIGHFRREDGKIGTFSNNFTHTWIPVGDGWKIAGGMCRPAPAE